MANIQGLIDIIKRTRKARINASERLKRWDFFSNLLIVYYSLILVGLSIWTLSISTKNVKLNIFLLISSVFLTIISIYVNSQKFNERYINLKHNYIELARLWSILENNCNDPNFDSTVIEEKYYTLMEIVENHKPYDYWKSLGLKNLKWPENLYYIYDISQEYIIYISLFLLPIIVGLLLNI